MLGLEIKRALRAGWREAGRVPVFELMPLPLCFFDAFYFLYMAEPEPAGIIA